jgi:Na+-translocating ferredoxin:NAD+ oxidoreductase subunit B
MVSATQIDAILPQTQCTRCGYSGCKPYALAIAHEGVAVNRCPPGGRSVLAKLNALLGQAHADIDPSVGHISPPRIAVIDPEHCIGCAKCLPACPVDAILGARKALHTVITPECSGCELCLPPCPVDCITLVYTSEAPLAAERIDADAKRYRERYSAHQQRVEQKRLAEQNRLATLSGVP